MARGEKVTKKEKRLLQLVEALELQPDHEATPQQLADAVGTRVDIVNDILIEAAGYYRTRLTQLGVPGSIEGWRLNSETTVDTTDPASDH